MRIFRKLTAALPALVALCSVVAAPGCATGPKQPSKERVGQIYLQNGTESLMAGKFGEALATLSRAVQLLPESAEAWNNLGLAYAARQEHNKAVDAWKRAIKINPRFSDARNNLGAMYLNQRKLSEAERELKLVVNDAIYANLHQAHFNLGLLYLQQNKPILAEQQLLLAVQNNESYCAAWYHLGMLQKRRNDMETATNSLKKSSGGYCFKNPEAHFELANIYLKSNRLPLAKSKYLELIQFFPETDFARQAEKNLSLLR